MTIEPLWTPSRQRCENSQMAHFAQAMSDKYHLQSTGYEHLHRWSTEQREDFWEEIWKLGDIIHSRPFDSVLENDVMPGAHWFTGSRLNFAENLLRYRDDRIAIVSLLEDDSRRTYTYAELYREVAQLAGFLQARGIGVGDRVAGFLPNIPETIVAMLACTAIGAIWSSCSPDFGIDGVVDRFGQIAPRILFTTDGYRYNGKTIDNLARARDVMERVSSIETLVLIPLLGQAADLPEERDIRRYGDCLSAVSTTLEFEQLPFDHPLYILYSSGTTGVPKCIVHGVGGTLLQHLKEHRLHTDLRREDVFFYFTTCGWMMWNWLVSGLASGCTLVLYDGSPFARQGQRLLDAIDEENITIFGTSARYLTGLEQQGFKPAASHRLDSLQTVLSTGSPLSAGSYEYVYQHFKHDVLLASISGGTDIVSTFVLGNPTLPVHAGEIQCPGLGMAVEVWDDQGPAAAGVKGELVCTRAFPCMPIAFWGDDGSKLQRAYFQRYKGVWAQGDYAERTARGGLVIHGRSDAVLNPGGVRIGTAEIYRQLEQVDGVLESVAVGQPWENDVRIVLFVILQPGLQLDDRLRQLIAGTIRKGASPRHVPARIVQVNDIPRTLSGKIAEIAVRDALTGQPIVNRDALANPESLNQFSASHLSDEE